MVIRTNEIISITEANRNFSKLVALAEENSRAVIFKNNRPRFLFVDLEKSVQLDLTDDEKLSIVAARVLKRYKKAFLELAK